MANDIGRMGGLEMLRSKEIAHDPFCQEETFVSYPIWALYNRKMDFHNIHIPVVSHVIT